MNRRGFMKAILAAPVAAKGTVQQVGDKLFSGGMAVSDHAIEVHGFSRAESGIGVADDRVNVPMSWAEQVKKAISWIKKKGVPPYLRKQALSAFNRQPSIPPDIACMKSVSPGAKYRMARERFVNGALRNWEKDLQAEAGRDELPEYMRDLWI